MAGGISLLAGGVNAIANYAGGWKGADFGRSMGLFAVSALFFGKGHALSWASSEAEGIIGIADDVSAKVSGFLEDSAIAVIGFLDGS